MANLQLNLDLGDIFMECEAGTEDCSSLSIAEALKDEIVCEAKKKVLGLIKEDARNEIVNQVTKCVKDEIVSTVKAMISIEFQTLKVKPRHHTETPAKDYIIHKLEEEILSSNISDIVNKVTKNYVDTIKERFDVVFASTLLDKMMKANLLKDDRIASLLKE